MEGFKFDLQMFNEGQVEQPQVDNSQASSDTGTSSTTTTTQHQFSNEKQNHAFAQMRTQNSDLQKRIAEFQSKETEYNEKINKMNNIIQGQFSNYGIKDIDGYLNYYDNFSKQQLQTKASQGDVEAIRELARQEMTNNPEFQKVKQMTDTFSNMMAKQKEQEDIASFNSKYGQDIHSYNDIANLPNADRILDYMQKNNLSLADAHALANGDSITNNSTQQAKQEAVNIMAGRQHMTANAKGGNATVNVPADVFKMYKQMMPNSTTAEIQEHYAKSLGR